MQFLTIYKRLHIGRCLMLRSCEVAKLRFFQILLLILSIQPSRFHLVIIILKECSEQ